MRTIAGTTTVRPRAARRTGLVFSAALALAGCMSTPLRELPDDPAYAPLPASAPAPDFQAQGGIRYARFGASLFSDRRAAQVGDIITVRLVESTQASKDADTEISKDSDLQFNEGVMLGNDFAGGEHSLETDVQQNREFKGNAESSQSNSLSGSIAVTVTEVTANGLLRVRGEKWLQPNRGQEYIRLSGLVRQEDLAPDNSVPSTRLADARIGYSGTGELAQSNNMGWLGKFFNSGVWPL